MLAEVYKKSGQYMSDIKKGSIVWFWHKPSKDWQKGKVIAVNRYGLAVRYKSKVTLLPIYQRAYTAYDTPKPLIPAPQSFTEWWKERGHEPARLK